MIATPTDLSSEEQTAEPVTTLVPAVLTLRALSADLGSSPLEAYLNRLAPGSIPAQRSVLRLCARLLVDRDDAEAAQVPWHLVRYANLLFLRQALQERGLKPATCNRALCAVRGVLKEAWRLGLMDAEAFHRACDVGQIKYEALPAGRALTPGELAALYDACAQNPSRMKGARDAAMLALLYPAGLRRTEAVLVDLADLVSDDDTATITVQGKGRKQRLTYCAGGGLIALRDWLALRGKRPGPLLCPVARGGHLTVRRLSDESVADVLNELATKARIADTSPHDLRRTTATDLLDAEVDLGITAALLGHASVNTTKRYDRRGERPKQRAVARLHVPYRSKV